MEIVGGKAEVDIDAMCRMCHHHLDAETSVAIFDDDSATTLPISAQIKVFTGIEVSSTDAMPKQLCLKCRLHLETSNLIRNKCKNLEAKLRKHLRIINAGRVSRVFEDDDDGDENEYSESIQVIEALSQRLSSGDQSENEALQTELEEMNRAYRELEVDLASAEAELEEVNRENRQLEADLASVGDDLDRANQEIDELEGTLSLVSADLKKSESSFSELEENLASVEHQLRQTEELCQVARENSLLAEAQLEEKEKVYQACRKELEIERNYTKALTETHEAEIVKVKLEAHEKLMSYLAAEPPVKRKQAIAKPHLDSIVSNEAFGIPAEAELDDAADGGAPNADGNAKTNKNGRSCRSCSDCIPVEIAGIYQREFEKVLMDFCSEECLKFAIDLFDDDAMDGESTGKNLGDQKEGAGNEQIEQTPQVEVDMSSDADESRAKVIPQTAIDEAQNAQLMNISAVSASPANPEFAEPTSQSVASSSSITRISGILESTSEVAGIDVVKTPASHSITPTAARASDVYKIPAWEYQAVSPDFMKALDERRASDLFKLPATQQASLTQHAQSTTNAGEMKKLCFSCKKVTAGSLSVKGKDGMKRYFCNPACLSRRSAPVADAPAEKVSAANAGGKAPATTHSAPGENSKKCFTCKNTIVGAGVSAKSNQVIYHFCDRGCFARAPKPSQPSPRPQSSAEARFHCEYCACSYKTKGSLKTHCKNVHPNQPFNNNIAAVKKN